MVKIFKSKYKLMKLQISLLVLLILFVYLHKTRENFFGLSDKLGTGVLGTSLKRFIDNDRFNPVSRKISGPFI
jgi:hypothetical protein